TDSPRSRPSSSSRATRALSASSAAVLMAYSKMFVSTNRTTRVDLVPSEAAGRPEPPDRGQDLLLKVLAPIEVGPVLRQTREVFPHQRADRGVLLGGFDAPPTVHMCGKGHGDVLHIFTVSRRVRPEANDANER